MPWIEQARLLLRKARQDVVIVSRAVDDPEIADEIVGFHVQQACEKCMKAVLCVRGVTYRRTHDLQELYDLLHDAGVALPDALYELVTWSPFAVAYRYEDWPAATAPVDRMRADYLVCAAIIWTEGELPPEDKK
ncbi:HEPN domain-containing protein [Candidatus Poribacteria bacterium]|nr:HEPN domain-containing protein [Candidatus Poribacteria bacterium]